MNKRYDQLIRKTQELKKLAEKFEEKYWKQEILYSVIECCNRRIKIYERIKALCEI